jgi:hypothetical protein
VSTSSTVPNGAGNDRTLGRLQMVVGYLIGIGAVVMSFALIISGLDDRTRLADARRAEGIAVGVVIGLVAFVLLMMPRVAIRGWRRRGSPWGEVVTVVVMLVFGVVALTALVGLSGWWMSDAGILVSRRPPSACWRSVTCMPSRPSRRPALFR